MLISNKSPLIFMHIPKTGGMSLFSAFTKHWGTDIADLYNISQRNPAPAVELVKDRSKAIYCGHYPIGLHEFLDRPSYYAAVVRDPVERVISLYSFCLPMLNHCRMLSQSKHVPLHKLFEQPDIPDYFDDFIPWMEGDQTPETFFSCPSAELDNGMVRRFSGIGLASGPCPDSALDLAKQNIEQYFSVVGVLERYPETLRLLERKLEIPTLDENKVNETRVRHLASDFDPKLLQRIERMNSLDIELYRWVNDRLDVELSGISKAISVPPGNRKDFGQIKLWKAVGQSPFRDIAMQTRELPPSFYRWMCKNLKQIKFTQPVFMLDMGAIDISRESGDAKLADINSRHAYPAQLLLSPSHAKRLANALAESVKLYEQKHGVIPMQPISPSEKQ